MSSKLSIGGHAASLGRYGACYRFSMLRKLYQKLLELAGGPKAEPALFAVSFAESSFFPIPPDVMLAPMVLARPERAWRYALVCTIASVLGALLGYAIGYLLYDTVGQWVIHIYGYADKVDAFRAAYAEFKETGYERTTTAGIGRKAIVSKSRTYRCFAIKLDLFHASVLHPVERD